MTPTVTLSGGLRWDLQTPFTADERHDVGRRRSTRSAACPAAARPRRRSTSATFYSLQEHRRRARVHPADERHEGLQTPTGTTSAPSVSVAWRPNVQSGFMRTILGDPEQATLRGGYSAVVLAPGPRRVHRPVRRQPRQHAHGDPQRQQRQPRQRGRDVAAAATADKTRLYPATFPATQTFPIADSGEPRQTA